MSKESGPTAEVLNEIAEQEPLRPEDQHLTEIEVCLPNNPNWPSLLGYLGSEYFKLGYYLRSRSAFSFLFEFDPEKSHVGQSLVRSQLQLGQRELAIDTLCTMMEKSNLTSEQRKWVREKLKELARGEQTQKPQQKSPEQSNIAEETNQMSGTLMRDLDINTFITLHGKSSDEQIVEVEEQLKKDPNNTMLLDWYAFVLYSNGRVSESIPAYERLIKEFQPNANRLYYLGSAYLADQKIREALTCWKYLQQWYPNSPLVKKVEKKLDKVRSALPKSFAQTTSNNNKGIDKLEFTDFTDYAQDKTNVAEVEAALQKDPSNLSVVDWTAFINYTNGNFDRALELYQRVVELDPENLHAYYYVGNIYCRTGRYAEAAQHWRILLDRFPEHKLASKAKPKLAKIEAVLDD